MSDSIFRVTDTASPDVCRQLHEATGWTGTGQWWNIDRRGTSVVTHYSRGLPRYANNGPAVGYCDISQTADTAGHNGVVEVAPVPAYDLGFLLRHVPPKIPSGQGEFGMFTLEIDPGGQWWAGYSAGLGSPSAVADTPEDAVAAVCVVMAGKGLVAVAVGGA